LFSALTAGTIFLIGEEVFGKHSGVSRIAAWLWALLPSMMFWAIRFPWETSLTAFLLSAVILFLLRREQDADLKSWLIFGALWGAIALSSPALLTLLPFFGMWWLAKNWQRRETLRYAIASGIVFSAMLLPWSIRNY